MKEYATLQYGLRSINGRTCCFSKEDSKMKTGFQVVSKKTYYFNPATCKMRGNTSWNYYGVTMKAGENGVITPTANSSPPRARILAWAMSHLGIHYGFDDGDYVCTTLARAAYQYAGETYLDMINANLPGIDAREPASLLGDAPALTLDEEAPLEIPEESGEALLTLDGKTPAEVPPEFDSEATLDVHRRTK